MFTCAKKCLANAIAPAGEFTRASAGTSAGYANVAPDVDVALEVTDEVDEDPVVVEAAEPLTVELPVDPDPAGPLVHPTNPPANAPSNASPAAYRHVLATTAGASRVELTDPASLTYHPNHPRELSTRPERETHPHTWHPNSGRPGMPRIEAGRSPSRCRGRIDCQDRTGSGLPWAFLEPFLEPFQEMFDEGDDGRSRPPSPGP